MYFTTPSIEASGSSLHVIDHFSQYTWARFYETKEAKNVKEFLEYIIENDGKRESYLTDNGKEFVAKKVQKLMSKYNIKEKHGKPYHPQTQGSIEKAHGPLKARLTKVLLEYHKGKLPSDLVKCNGILNRLIAAKNHEVHYTTNAIPFTVKHFLIHHIHF